MLAELVEGNEVTAFVLADEFVQVGIDLHVVLRELLPEFLSIHVSLRVILQLRAYLPLEGVDTLAWGPGNLDSLGSVEILVVGLDWGQVGGIFL